MKKDKIALAAVSAASLAAGLSLASTNAPAAQTQPAKDSTLAQALPMDSVSSAVLFDSDGRPWPPTPGFIG